MVFEFMANPVTITGWSLLSYIFGWIFFFGLFVAFLYVLNKTPAMTFIKASWTRQPVISVDYRDGRSRLLTGNQEIPGTISVKKVGSFQLVEGSATRETKSGVAMYHAFAEFGTTIPKWYPAVLQELRSMGVAISKYKDYEAFVKMLGSYAAQKKIKRSLSSSNKTNFDVMLNRVKDEQLKNVAKVETKPFKSYAMHELATMFPFNLNPAYIEAYAQAKLNAYIKKHKANMDLLIYGSVAVLILIIGCVIAYKFISDGDSGAAVNVVCQFPEAAQNVTRVINSSVSA